SPFIYFIMESMLNSACDLASLVSSPFLGATPPTPEDTTPSGAEEESFEIVDAASTDDELEEDEKLSAGNQTNKERSEEKIEVEEAEETAPVVAFGERDAATPEAASGAATVAAAATPAVAATRTEKDEAAVENGPRIPSLRLIRVELRSDESECGMEVYRMDSDGFGVGAIIKDSGADRAGLVPGDRICFINTVSIEKLRDAEVLDLLLRVSAEKSFEVLTLHGVDLELYKELGLRVSPHLPNIIRGAAASESPLALQVDKPEDGWKGCWLPREGYPILIRVDEETPGYKAGFRARIVGVESRLFRCSTAPLDVCGMLTPGCKLWVTSEKKRERMPLLPRLQALKTQLMKNAVFELICTVIGMLLLRYMGVWASKKYITYTYYVCVGIIAAACAVRIFPRLHLTKLLYNCYWLLHLVFKFDQSWTMALFILFRVCTVYNDYCYDEESQCLYEELTPYHLEAKNLKKRAAEIEKNKINELNSSSQISNGLKGKSA
ncbi:hypothetical protein PFISCL1PPCAC_8978, partial [Pristionchus fissidentatus]